MITRSVPSCAGFGAASEAEGGGGISSHVRRPDELLRQTHATSLAGIFSQIASVAEHSFELFRELQDESARLHERYERIQDRVNTVATLAGVNDSDAGSERSTDDCHLPTRDASDSVLHIPELSFTTSVHHPALVKAYEQCEPMPPLELLEEFAPARSTAKSTAAGANHLTQKTSHARSKYSDPTFFMTEWMAQETSRQQRVLQARETRRRERREHKREQSLSLSLQQQQQLQLQQQQQTPHETECSGNYSTTAGSEREMRSKTTSTGGGSDSANKFLKIRSWREIYGTGEGKELARQQQKDEKERSAVSVAGESGTLDGKKSSQKMLETGVAAASVECEADETPGTLPAPVQSSLPAVLASFEEYTGGIAPFDLEHYQLDYARYAPPPLPPPVPPTSPPCSGAFMQEIDGDDELFSDFDCSSAFERDARPSGTNVPESDEFVDHGLSYYYDPAIALHQLVPPPPPPPPEDAESDDEYYEPALSDVFERDENGDDGSFVPPPPPPPLPYVLETYNGTVDMPSRPPSSLLQAIQLGTSLRHIKIDEESDGDDDDRGDDSSSSNNRKHHDESVEAAAPTLLEQIKMKQRSLRPVEPPPPRRVPVATRTAPFADSIARILERRSVIAYDSDSSDSNASDAGASEW